MSRITSTIFEVPYVVPSTGLSPTRLVNPPRLWEGLKIEVEPIVVTLSQRGNISHYPPAAINPALNQAFAVPHFDIVTSVDGLWLNTSINAEPIEVTVSVPGTMIIGKLLNSSSLITVIVSLGSPEMVTVGSKMNWVKWSNIGSLDFTIWKDNIAGERPLDWPGWVYSIKKLGNKAIVYGGGGISMLAPSGNTYGLLPVHKIGIKGKQAIAGDEKTHFFVDNTGVLYSVGEISMKSSMFEASINPTKLGYAEFLSSMIDPILSWDSLNNLLYICDGVLGYVYSSNDKSLGSGPVNITGIGVRSNNLYVTAPETIVNPIFEICTDIYDLGSRKNKTIGTVELGTDVTGDLWVTLDYRRDKAAEFKTLPWHKVSPNGVTNIPCFGVEFRIRVKRTTYAYFELDYIRVNGIVHDYNFLYPYVGR